MNQSRTRHILFDMHYEGLPINSEDLIDAIRKSLHTLYGEVSVAQSRLYLDEYDEQSGTGILQCNSESLHRVLSAAALIRQIGKTPVSFNPRKSSGTIRGLSK